MSKLWSDTCNNVVNLLVERGKQYGDNLQWAYALKSVYRAMSRAVNRVGDPAHEECIEQILTKISRIGTGVIHSDNYDDIIGYALKAKERAMAVFYQQEQQDAERKG